MIRKRSTALEPKVGCLSHNKKNNNKNNLHQEEHIKYQSEITTLFDTI